MEYTIFYKAILKSVVDYKRIIKSPDFVYFACVVKEKITLDDVDKLKDIALKCGYSTDDYNIQVSNIYPFSVSDIKAFRI